MCILRVIRISPLSLNEEGGQLEGFEFVKEYFRDKIELVGDISQIELISIENERVIVRVSYRFLTELDLLDLEELQLTLIDLIDRYAYSAYGRTSIELLRMKLLQDRRGLMMELRVKVPHGLRALDAINAVLIDRLRGILAKA